MTEPPSRQFEAYEANGWPNEVAEYDPHGVAAGGMYSQCDGCSSREWYGPNPWSAPGTARHFDFVMGGSGGNMLGVCGASPSRDNNQGRGVVRSTAQYSRPRTLRSTCVVLRRYCGYKYN